MEFEVFAEFREAASEELIMGTYRNRRWRFIHARLIFAP